MANPWCFDFSAAESSSVTPTAEQRAQVHRVLLNSRVSNHGISARFKLHTISSTGHVQISPSSPASAWISQLAECGDWRCGCYRLTRPEVRCGFRDFAANKTFETLAGKSVRYASIGSGLLLLDFEILCALAERGLRIERISLIDTCYRYAHGVVGDARIDPTDGNAYSQAGFEEYYKPLLHDKWAQQWENALQPAQVADAISQVAHFFPSTKVLVFPSIDHFREACTVQPSVFGGSNCFVHADAGGVSREASRDIAGLSLECGGLAFFLENQGHHAQNDLGPEPWPRNGRGKLTEQEHAYLSSLMTDASRMECWRCTTTTEGSNSIEDVIDERCGCLDRSLVAERRRIVTQYLPSRQATEVAPAAMKTLQDKSTSLENVWIRAIALRTQRGVIMSIQRCATRPVWRDFRKTSTATAVKLTPSQG
eukprot:CAMPEP_0119328560 /NCGR_PEP_ID=MMETSP1333-20130426/73630_1 /TAXON_ID=418940 /ORGANISM="Scyphosphaera apsteinii, Strain RCC1455" /LENGTH=424 /DNA_ID=CAMNT_0007337447 /DNA_START=168 /DNA_END=1442 /DNA_ORIENTATION=+